MKFVSDDQRKAVFARLRGGGHSTNGYSYPSFIHGAPAGPMVRNTLRPPTTPRGQIQGKTKVFLPNLPYQQGTIQTTQGTTPKHGGGMGDYSLLGQALGIPAVLAGATLGGPPGAVLMGAGLLGGYTVPMLPGWGQPLGFFSELGANNGGYSSFQDWFNALNPAKKTTFTEFMFGNTLFDNFSFGAENLQGGQVEFSRGENMPNSFGGTPINWHGDWSTFEQGNPTVNEWSKPKKQSPIDSTQSDNSLFKP